MSKLLALGGAFPWVRQHTCPPPATTYMEPLHPLQRRGLPLVVLPDGRIGVIHHLKTDGNLGVRPLDSAGEFLPNTSAHWSDLQRRMVPEEVAIHSSQLRPPRLDELPALLRPKE